MPYQYSETMLRAERVIALQGYAGEAERLVIPSALPAEDGTALPVRIIGDHAFDGMQTLTWVSIPESVRVLRPFAFYKCRNLHYLSLTDSVQDYYDGVIRQCRDLALVELHAETSGRFQLLKEMLGDNDSRLRFRIYLPDGVCGLSFPAFFDNFHEDTMSRAIHESIEGSGYEYRQTVSRTELDFWTYDKLFSRVIYDDPTAAMDIAVERLQFPYQLSEQAREIYRNYLQREGEAILRRLIGRRDTEAVRFLCTSQLLRPEAIQAVLPLCAGQRLTELTAVLMQACGNRARQGRPMEMESFEL